VVGLGGITEPDHAIQYLLAGASAIQTGTVNFIDPHMPLKILDGIKDYMAREGLSSVADFKDLIPRA
jgi:dihydroorotate dehydrogenase (NAD+) catalytic subunit